MKTKFKIQVLDLYPEVDFIKQNMKKFLSKYGYKQEDFFVDIHILFNEIEPNKEDTVIINIKVTSAKLNISKELNLMHLNSVTDISDRLLKTFCDDFVNIVEENEYLYGSYSKPKLAISRRIFIAIKKFVRESF